MEEHAEGRDRDADEDPLALGLTESFRGVPGDAEAFSDLGHAHVLTHDPQPEHR